jgi:Fe(3+) dicitrate transport protein
MPNRHWSIKADLVWSDLLSQQPGGLSDSMIRVNARNSVRARNWMNIQWLMPTLTAIYQKGAITSETRLTILAGNRNSVGFLPAVGVPDSPDALTGQWSNRKVQQDRYNNISIESKWMIQANRKGLKSILFGIRYFQGRTGRLADGTGTAGSDPDFSSITPFLKDQQFQSRNMAVFTELIIPITARWILLPGARLEHLQSAFSGETRTTTGNTPVALPTTQKPRTFLVAGIGTEYHFTASSEFYAGFSQAYRPVLFSQLIQQPGLEVVDENVRDARGFNLDVGVRGKINNRLTFDISFYSMNYNDRIGTIRVGEGADAYRLITNIGSSFSRGFESLLEYRHRSALASKKKVDWLFFGSFALVRSWYSAYVKDRQVAGKQVEHAPAHIIRGGAQIAWKGLCTQLQVSYTSSSFSDARNTEQPSSDGQFGRIPAYTVLDWTAEQRLFSKFSIKAGINNLMDVRYFTRRASSYPGPGAMPADGRTFFMTIIRSF